MSRFCVYASAAFECVLTLSSTATFRDFHTNSQTAITHATPMPPINTTKTPPTLAKPNSFAAELDLDDSSRHDPPPRFSFHHLVLSICSLPSSCSLRTAPLIAVRYGESLKVLIFNLRFFYTLILKIGLINLLGGIAIPYPFESSMLPT